MRSPFEREMLSSSFTDLPNASSVGSLNHATLSNCVRRSVVCIPNMSTFRAFRSFVCLSVFACTPVHSNSLTTSTDSLARIAGALTKQLSVLPLSKHVSHTCLTSSSSTRVFHSTRCTCRRVVLAFRSRSCHFRQWRIWCRSHSVLICCNHPQPTVNFARVDAIKMDTIDLEWVLVRHTISHADPHVRYLQVQDRR